MALIIPTPLGYTDSPTSRARLCHKVQQKMGASLQVETFRNGETHLTENPVWNPEREILTLAPKLTASSAAELDAQARSRGRSLISYDAAARQAVTAAIPPAHRLIRDRIASLLKCAPWDVGCEVRWADGHLDTVVIRKAPSLNLDAEKRRELWRTVVASLPDGSLGWAVVEDTFTGTVTLTWGVRPELPKLAPARDVVPQTIDKSLWWSLPIGLDVKGGIVGFDLRLGPHGLIAGPTGSGKSIALLAIMTSCLMRGHSVVVIDPQKGGADFKPLRPWALAWVGEGELRQAFEIMNRLYQEGMRRRALVLEHGVGGVRDLPDEVIEGENLHPITAFIDEYPMLVAPEPEIEGLDKKDPENVEIQERNGYRGRLKHRTLKVAAELRSVNISVHLGAQRADAKYLDGYTRSQLSSVLQLAKPGSIPSSIDLGMVMASDLVPVASELFRTLDDGFSRGIGVVQGDGGAMGAVRVGFAKAHVLAESLAEKGVPEVENPWVVEPQTPAEAPKPAYGKRPGKNPFA